MNKFPSITVICVLYYSSHLVETFLENITQKIVCSIKQVIFINNSPDRFIQKQEYYPLDIMIINNDSNIGYGAALNIGARYAKYNTLVLCNPDIQLTEFTWPDSINKYNLYFLSGIINKSYTVNRLPNIFDLLVNYGFSRMYGKLVYPLLLFRRLKINDFNEELKRADWFSGCFIITNKETYFQLGGFDERFFLFFEETDLFKRAKMQNIPLFISNKIMIQTQNGRSSSIDVNKIKKKAEAESMLKFVEKYYKPVTFKLFSNALYAATITNIYILQVINCLFHSIKATNKKEYYILFDNILKSARCGFNEEKNS